MSLSIQSSTRDASKDVNTHHPLHLGDHPSVKTSQGGVSETGSGDGPIADHFTKQSKPGGEIMMQISPAERALLLLYFSFIGTRVHSHAISGQTLQRVQGLTRSVGHKVHVTPGRYKEESPLDPIVRVV